MKIPNDRSLAIARFLFVQINKSAVIELIAGLLLFW